jgi:UrcA family protein
MTNLKAAISAVGLLSIAICSAPAIAQGDSNRKEQVSFVDLDVGQNAGKISLEQRIRSAAARVCSSDGEFDFTSVLASHRCYQTAVSNGLSQMSQMIASRKSGTYLASTTLVIRGR